MDSVSSFDAVASQPVSQNLPLLTVPSSDISRNSIDAESSTSDSNADAKSEASRTNASKSATATRSAENQGKPKLTRARGPKVRTGCGTCKIRHKKCGEERPYCLNCVTKGYKCEGYADSGRPSAGVNKQRRVIPTEAVETVGPLGTGYAVAKSAEACATQPLRPLGFAGKPQWYPAASLEEQSCFNFFRKHTAPQLSRGVQSEFWSYYVLRLSNEFDCVKHAIITLGALHKETALHLAKWRDSDRLLRGGASGGADAGCDGGVTGLLVARSSLIVAEHSSRALDGLRELVKADGSKYTELILSVCLLFVCIDVIRGQYSAAFVHLRSGMNLLLETGHRQMQEQYNPSSAEEVPGLQGENSLSPAYPTSSPHAIIPVESMIPIFTRLDTQASDLLDSRVYEPMLYDVRPPRPSCVPDFFDSYEEASHSMLAHQSYFLFKMRLMSHTYPTPFLTFAPPHVMEELHYFRDWCLQRQEKWHVAFEALTERNIRERRSDHLRKGPLSLLAYHHFIHTHLLRFPDQSGLWCDKNQGRMIRIFSAAEAALNAPDANSVDTSRSHFDADSNNGISLCFDIGLAEPLFYVATKCRDPALRRKAVRLLHREIPSYDGIWNKPFATQIAARIIEIEESGTFHQDPGVDPRHRLRRRVAEAAEIPRNARIRDISPMLDSDTGKLKVWFYRGTGREEDDGWFEDEFKADDIGRMIANDELGEGLI